MPRWWCSLAWAVLSATKRGCAKLWNEEEISAAVPLSVWQYVWALEDLSHTGVTSPLRDGTPAVLGRLALMNIEYPASFF